MLIFSQTVLQAISISASQRSACQQEEEIQALVD
jgi:hypothetical protein